jgi:hypothetical protein
MYNYILPLLAAILSWTGYFATAIIAFLIASIYLVGHIAAWWIPYFFGCSQQWKERMNYAFGRTMKILPPIKDHPIPNLEHLPVGLFIVGWFVAALCALIRL